MFHHHRSGGGRGIIVISISYKTGMVFTIDIPVEAVEDALPCMLDSVHNNIVFECKEKE